MAGPRVRRKIPATSRRPSGNSIVVRFVTSEVPKPSVATRSGWADIGSWTRSGGVSLGSPKSSHFVSISVPGSKSLTCGKTLAPASALERPTVVIAARCTSSMLTSVTSCLAHTELVTRMANPSGSILVSCSKDRTGT